jgi:2-dehydropantoate 2-reductase
MTIPSQPDWRRVGVVGAGAVGCYFGGMLARAGSPVTLVGRSSHVDAIRAKGLDLERADFRATVRLGATTDISAIDECELVLLCVKTLGTESAAREIAPHLGSKAVLLCLQNGVDNAERVRAATGLDPIPAVVYVAAEMVEPGHVRHSGSGQLAIGEDPARPRTDQARPISLGEIAAQFAGAGVPCAVSANIAIDLWRKMVMNCTFNAISALTRTRYGQVVANPETRALIGPLVDEAVAVAAASGVELPAAELAESARALAAERMPNAYSSTGQDLSRGKPTEIDSLNGYLVRRGQALGVPTPINRTLHALVKLAEATAGAGPSQGR